MAKVDAYQVITDRLVAQLEAGVVPWSKPWRSADAPLSFERRRPYRGVNVLMLQVTAATKGYTAPYWATFRQCQAAGGSVRKGEHGTPVVLWKPVTRGADDAGEEQSSYMLLRYFTVFNVEQCNGLEIPEASERDPFEPLDAAESIVTGYRDGPTIRHGGDRAAYSPTLDMVTMPYPSDFIADEMYYSTLFHELVHSTGHESRLNRPIANSFGSDPYAREELVAEIGACFLLSECDVEPDIQQPAAYVAGWLKALKDDRRLVVSAAAGAQKAADRILGRVLEPVAAATNADAAI